MMRTEHYPYRDGEMPNHELLEVHHNKISLHHAKADYGYPTIRLPHTFSKLAGLPTHIYQTVHDGALAFLLVFSPSNKAAEESAKKSENAAKSAKSSALTWRRAGSNPTEPIISFYNRLRQLGRTTGTTRTKSRTTLMRLKIQKNGQTTTVTTPPLRDIWKRGSVSMNCTQNNSSQTLRFLQA